ncbi:MAG TPA: carbohydrate ABC transporter permease [Vitreimonas sp.]|jgi:multiple sugar transport system permease protein|nr:carbohydrate ABC transporter permease [Vitreimonas sp.]
MERTTARQHRAPRMRGLGWASAHGVLLALALFCTVPFGWLFLAAVDPGAGLYLEAPDRVSLDNFVRVFTEADSLRLLVNSMIMSGGAVLLVLAVCTLAGYALSRYDFRGRRALLFGVLLTRVIPPAATIAPLYAITLRLGLVDTYQGLILVLAAQQLPFVLWMMKGFFDTVPVELEEAAWIDGAGRIHTAFRVVLPLAGPGVAAAGLFAFIGAWGEFLTPLVLVSSPDLWPISLGLFRAWVAYTIVDWGLLAAISLLYMAPAVVFYLLVRRFLLKATLLGGLHGTA